MQRFEAKVSLFSALLLGAAVTLSCGKPASGSGTVSPSGSAAAITVTSPAFGEGQPIPIKHTEDGQNISPELRWTPVPQGAKQLALIVDDPDAPSATPWVHWVIYRLPGATTGLPEAVPADENLSNPPGAAQGKNSWGTVGYRGPAPPKGKVHHYQFTVYALDVELPATSGIDKPSLIEKMQGHVIGQGQLVGTYQR